MANAEWVWIVTSQGQRISKKKNIETYKLEGDYYKFDTNKGTMRKVRKDSKVQTEYLLR